uniref:Uncharacterized protein n=1 Tax=Tanacetum cinerariifolium TaxID=118510 RepID=A0A699S8I5_TANCI|nr:hypothetical protein [Tanacetum cinerariifolium]
MLHGHGDDGYRHTAPILADFSTNVWYGGPPVGLQDYVFSQWPTVSRYPEVLAESLGARIAAHHGVAPAQVLRAGAGPAIDLAGCQPGYGVRLRHSGAAAGLRGGGGGAGGPPQPVQSSVGGEYAGRGRGSFPLRKL